MTRWFSDERDWFQSARYGLFLHWGVYAVPAWHEQIQYRQGLSRPEYEPFVQQFNPVEFDPDRWLDIAEASGMRYLTFTTKHIDGFCMWDSALTEYKITNTPYGRDTLAMLAAACHRRNIPLCLYYSFVDHHHPNYPNEGRAHELSGPQPGDEPDVARYVDYVKGQIRELCTKYGKIHGIWWDAQRLGVEDTSLNDMIRELQPAALINDRGLSPGDITVYERDYSKTVYDIPAFATATEACQAIGLQSWGFREDEDYYTTKYMIQSIDRMMAKGANYLLNVGPDALGRIALNEEAMLRRIGDWYQRVKESFDAEAVPRWTDNRQVLTSQRGRTIYVHLHEVTGNALVLHPIRQLPERVTLLNDGREMEACLSRLPVHHKDPEPCLRIPRLPVEEMEGEVMVLRLDFADEIGQPGTDGYEHRDLG
jgi:alpha-L-fucosidase